jgi:hypothetical protein
MVRPARSFVDLTGRLCGAAASAALSLERARAGEHALAGAGGLEREQTDERGKNDQELDDAYFVPHLDTSFLLDWNLVCSLR